MPHKKGTGERILPEVHSDFCFLGDEAKAKDGTKVEDTTPVLVVREVTSKMTLSTSVLSKSTGTFVARRVVAFLREIGCLQRDVVPKSDQEQVEIEFVRQIKLNDKVDWEDCIRMTGRPPVSTKWVEVDKGTAEKPDVRCRLVVLDFRVKGEGHRNDLFAAMPPWGRSCS